MNYAGMVIQRTDKRMLFQLRDNNPEITNPNVWGLFGGGIKPGEKPISAAIRELEEELGVTANEDDLKLLIESPPFFANRFHIYRIQWDKSLSELSLREGSDMRYFSLGEILAQPNVAPQLRQFLEHYQRLPSLYGDAIA